MSIDLRLMTLRNRAAGNYIYPRDLASDEYGLENARNTTDAESTVLWELDRFINGMYIFLMDIDDNNHVEPGDCCRSVGRLRSSTGML
jgi:hypothetical protein